MCTSFEMETRAFSESAQAKRVEGVGTELNATRLMCASVKEDRCAGDGRRLSLRGFIVNKHHFGVTSRAAADERIQTPQ
jgi:hypothetical protein